MGSGSFVEFHDSVNSKQDDELLLRHRRALLRRAYPEAPRARWVSGMSTRWVDWSHSGIYNFKFGVPVGTARGGGGSFKNSQSVPQKSQYMVIYDANVFGESCTYIIYIYMHTHSTQVTKHSAFFQLQINPSPGSADVSGTWSWSSLFGPSKHSCSNDFGGILLVTHPATEWCRTRWWDIFS